VFAVAGGIGNNSFSRSQMEGYYGTRLFEQDKQDILDRIPDPGVALWAGGEAQAFGIAYGPLAFVTKSVVESKATLPKAAAELVLFGNTLNRTYSLDDSDGWGWGVVSYILSGAKTFHVRCYSGPFRRAAWFDLYHRIQRISVGTSVKYARGIGYGEITQTEGGMITTEDQIQGNGKLVARSAVGGSGTALDVGVAALLEGHWTIGVSVINAFTRMKWDQEPKETLAWFTMHMRSLDDLSDEEALDHEDTTRTIRAFCARLPRILRVGWAAEWPRRRLLLALDYEQIFGRVVQGTQATRGAMGVEMGLWSWLFLRTGVSFNGWGYSVGAGLGVHFEHVRLDMGTGDLPGLLGRGKEMSAGLGGTVIF